MPATGVPSWITGLLVSAALRSASVRAPVEVARKTSASPAAAFIRIVWFAARTLSAAPAPKTGSVKSAPFTVIFSPDFHPATARSCAEKLCPAPSAFAAPGFVSAEIAVLLNASFSVAYVRGACPWAMNSYAAISEALPAASSA